MRFATIIAIIAVTFSSADCAHASTDRKLNPKISKMAREYYREKDDQETYHGALKPSRCDRRDEFLPMTFQFRDTESPGERCFCMDVQMAG